MDVFQRPIASISIEIPKENKSTIYSQHARLSDAEHLVELKGMTEAILKMPLRNCV